MLLRFGAENHLSIRDRQELILTADKRVSRSGQVVAVPVLRQDALPVAVVYGANASGKTNLVAALGAMRSHVVMSHKSDAGEPIRRRPFLLDDASAEKPSRFDCLITIASQDSDAPQEVYEYGFECTDAEYNREWLHGIVRNKRQTTRMLFERKTADGKTQIGFGGHLRGENRTIAALTRPNSLFLSAAAQNNHAQLGAIHRQFAEGWQWVPSATSEFGVAESLEGLAHKDAFMELMRQADLGVVGVEVEEYELAQHHQERLRKLSQALADVMGSSGEDDESILHRKRLRFQHASNGGVHPLDYDLESRGTQRLAALAIPALNAIEAGRLIVVDELDASLHHRLTAALVRLFKSGTNQHGAQLITTVHDTSLLRDGLELDDVWLAEKDSEGVSRFTPLTDFRIRSRDDIERVYREGRVGGAPVIGDLALALGELRHRECAQ